MSDDKDDGTSQVLIERFVEYRLPMLLKIKKRVDAGETLNDGDIDILARILEQEKDFGGFAERYPKYKEMIAKVIDLYNDITEKALENEKNAGGTSSSNQ
jgi:hypothetical protein